MEKSITMRAPNGLALNSRVDLEPRGLVLHSRSGTDRNRDYREALKLIMSRLDACGIQYDLFLDSRPVQHLPLEQRRLVFSRPSPIAERFNAIVRAMNAGSASNGAWRRLLITAAGKSPLELADAVAGKDGGQTQTERLAASTLRLVTPQHVDQAVTRLLSGQDAANFAASRDFDLITPTGERLAPKKVFGLALEAAISMEARPEHFSAGRGTVCFQILEAAGYPVVAKGELIPGHAVEPVDEDLAAAEGRPRLVTHLKRERNPALAAAKRRAMIAQFGHLKCERCRMVPSVELGPFGDAVIEVHHSGTLVSGMQPNHVTRLSDLLCLCANCHRIVHGELTSDARLL